MGIAADITADWAAALAALAWQFDMGVTEALGDDTLCAYDLPDRAEWQVSGQKSGQVAAQIGAQIARQSAPHNAATLNAAPQILRTTALDSAIAAAGACQSLTDLQDALARFDHLDLKRGARAMVFGAGHPSADVMVLGDPPNREDERAATPFAQNALLDTMFSAIGLTRDNPDPAQALYLACALPWRTPQDRAPDPAEIDIIRPFVARHVALVAPKVVVLMGNSALQLALGRGGIARIRGQWQQAFGLPAMPMLSQPQDADAKRDAWADLLAIKARLR